jgi:hypothetical protein
VIANAAAGTATDTAYTPVAVAWGAAAPPTAAKLRLQFDLWNLSAADHFYASPNNNGWSPVSGHAAGTLSLFTRDRNVSHGFVSAEWTVESSNIYYACDVIGIIAVSGYEDNL